MFTLDFKPQFYSYPLNTSEYARIKLRNQEIRNQIDKLENQLRQLNSKQNSSQYQPYKNRLIDKINVCKQELREYAQVLDCHEHIDACLKNSRKNNPEIKHRLLEEYKAESIAKKYKKASERLREVQKQKQLLRANQYFIQASIQRSKAKQQLERAFANTNQEKYVYGNKYAPKISTLMYSSEQKQQRKYSNLELTQNLNRLSNLKLPKIAYSSSTKAQFSENNMFLSSENKQKYPQNIIAERK